MLTSEVAKAILKQVDMEFQSERQYIAMTPLLLRFPLQKRVQRIYIW